jgi:hypothetical protein
MPALINDANTGTRETLCQWTDAPRRDIASSCRPSHRQRPVERSARNRYPTALSSPLVDDLVPTQRVDRCTVIIDDLPIRTLELRADAGCSALWPEIAGNSLFPRRTLAEFRQCVSLNVGPRAAATHDRQSIFELAMVNITFLLFLCANGPCLPPTGPAPFGKSRAFTSERDYRKRRIERLARSIGMRRISAKAERDKIRDLKPGIDLEGNY